jgi:hypothetical protein
MAPTLNKKKAVPQIFVINAEVPVNDQLIVAEQLVRFLFSETLL